MMIAKTPSLSALIREVGISPTLKILGNHFWRLLLYSPSAGQVNVEADLALFSGLAGRMRRMSGPQKTATRIGKSVAVWSMYSVASWGEADPR